MLRPCFCPRKGAGPGVWSQGLRPPLTLQEAPNPPLGGSSRENGLCRLSICFVLPPSQPVLPRASLLPGGVCGAWLLAEVPGLALLLLGLDIHTGWTERRGPKVGHVQCRAGPSPPPTAAGSSGPWVPVTAAGPPTVGAPGLPAGPTRGPGRPRHPHPPTHSPAPQPPSSLAP